MAGKDVFKIEVLNWDKHNGQRPKGKLAFTHFMVANRIFDDHKMVKLTTSERLLYVILLTCCADAGAKQITCSREGIKMRLGSSKEAVEKQLLSLERNQLVRVLEQPTLIKEEKRIEEKRKENKLRKGREKQKASQPDAAAPVPLGQNLVAVYCDAYKTRYPENPVIRPQDAKALKNLGETVGVNQAEDLLRAYLRMNNSWFITKAHDLTTFLQNLNQVKNFSATGQVVTIADARNAEAGDSLKNQIARLTGGES